MSPVTRPTDKPRNPRSSRRGPTADARDGGTFQRVGGGPLDPATGDWGQGAFNADDNTRAAVVYTRHWELTGDPDSRQKAYELLRTVA